MSNLKYFDNINKAILKAQEKFGEDATLAYLEGYISSLRLKRLKALIKGDNTGGYESWKDATESLESQP